MTTFARLAGECACIVPTFPMPTASCPWMPWTGHPSASWKEEGTSKISACPRHEVSGQCLPGHNIHRSSISTLTRKGHVYYYIDDFECVAPSQADAQVHFGCLQVLLTTLGLDEAKYRASPKSQQFDSLTRLP